MSDTKLLHSLSIPLNEEKTEYLFLQQWRDKPNEFVLKISRKDGANWINVESVHVPFSVLEPLSKGLDDLRAKLSIEAEIENALKPLFEKHGQEAVVTVFDKIRKSRVGVPNP